MHSYDSKSESLKKICNGKSLSYFCSKQAPNVDTIVIIVFKW